MATLLLAAAGSAVGGLLGTTGAILGQAAGALVGGAVDQWLFGDKSTRQIGRLSSLDVQGSSEGEAIPRVYGRVRIAGQVIWATRFEEVRDEQGGKGGPKVENFSYFANFAVALCEGPIAHIGRVWANGELLDLTNVQMRVHRGSEGQGVDSLISARQGDSPAYRGTAYVVFERLPISEFGNTIPQLSFEVIRPVGDLEPMIRAVTLIPGSTEFGYATEKVVRQPRRGAGEPENRVNMLAATDVEAALDEMQAVLPNLESVAIVVSWFGDNLRVANCQVRPKVEDQAKVTLGQEWRVSGTVRSAAETVSRVAGRPAFGGTPSDQSVVQLIAAIRARGLRVTFYPFVMMDVPSSNSLPDPYGGGNQATYPWRGRITCHPAPGRSGSPDGTGAVTSDVADFMGNASPGDFAASGTVVTYSGPSEWSYRRMILHYARLCDAAGGVDSFLVGSEMRGLTTLRGGGGSYPFVTALRTLTMDVRGILGSSTKIGYAADWSEWFGHQHDGNLTFHLDPLWSDPDIDFVGIDAYLPLSDWREGTHLDASVAPNVYDLDYLRSNVEGGEGYDWYYASDEDRRNNQRSVISDGAYFKPWVYRYKDIRNWWQNRHYNRVDGVEASSPTGWVPGMKPIRFTEIGCPAVDFGANEPNVFPDTVSSEGRSPVFSDGTRDDAMQRRYLQALIGYFDPTDPDYQSGRNPLSPVDGRRMVDYRNAHVWTYDARPYPWFPLALDVWSDGGNWATGHWINGRMGAAPLSEVIREIAKDIGLTAVSTQGVSAVVDGLVLADRSSPRGLIEALCEVFEITATERESSLVFQDRRVTAARVIDAGQLVDEDKRALVEIRRRQDEDVPGSLTIRYLDSERDGLQASVTARRDRGTRAEDVALPVTASAAILQAAVDRLMKARDGEREQIELALSPTELALEAGDVISLERDGLRRSYLIDRIEDGDKRQITGHVVDVAKAKKARRAISKKVKPASPLSFVPPTVTVLDLPVRDAEADYQPWIAATSVPWPGRISVSMAKGGGYSDLQSLDQAAVMGELTSALGAGVVWRYDRKNVIEVELISGILSSVSEAALLDGANLAAVGSASGGFEVLQFRDASLIGERRYRLSHLLRGQGGSEALAAAGHASGAEFVLLNRAVQQVAFASTQVGRSATLRAVAAGRSGDATATATLAVTPKGRGLVPLSPVHIRLSRDPGNGDVTIRWSRRTRRQGDDFESEDVPLAEAFEAYRLEIRAGSLVKRVLTATTPVVLYTLAQQLADFGSLPSSLDLSLCQIADRAGAGTPLEGIFNV